jgi:MoxR-like ATPase
LTGLATPSEQSELHGLDDAALADRLEAASKRIRTELAKVIVGNDDIIEQALIALFAGGNCLLVGVPGLAKTLLISTLSRALDLKFSRIQFTPDLMPSDVTGTDVIQDDPTTGQRRLTFMPGPVFANVLLADEINRTPPKTQAALLEAMQEHAVTFDGTTHSLGRNFMVVATQNPIEHQGVYPLPEAQLDRFLFKHRVSYPGPEEERAIIIHHGGGSASHDNAQYGIKAQTDRKTLEKALETVGSVTLVDDVVGYIAALVRATRDTADLEVGASPRAGAMLARAARARAALDGRAYVIPDDVKALAVPALRHRVVLSPAAQIDGRLVEQIVSDLVDQTEAPR